MTRQPTGILRRPDKRRGAMLVLIVFLMVGILATAALMIGVAQMQLARTELRAATDAAAKSAAEQLARSQNPNAAVRRGQEVAEMNLVQGQPLLLDKDDFEFGRSVEDRSSGHFVFSASARPLNSVRVTGRRTAQSRSGAIPYFMGNVFSSDNFEPSQTVTATYVERDIVLVVDRSSSMYGSKFGELQSALSIFTATLRQTPVEELVGLASYSRSARSDVPMTLDLGRIDSAMASMTVSSRTNITSGMVAGRAILDAGRSRDFVERTMIVMTDGRHNTGPEPRSVAAELAADGVVIHTITFGKDADMVRMREVAAIGRGRFYYAANGNELRDVYREIALTLSTLLTE